MNSTTEAVKASVEDQGIVSQSPPSTAHTSIDGPYAKYVLAILVVMGMFNFIDRQIYLSPPYDCQKWTLPVG